MSSILNPDNNLETDVLLIHPPFHRRFGSGTVLPLGLGYIAAVLQQAGFSVKILDGALICDSLRKNDLRRFKQKLAHSLQHISPRLCIGIGPCTTPAFKGILATVHAVKWCYEDIPLFFGGPYPSIEGQEAIFFDQLQGAGIIRGEGEETFLDVVFALRDKVSLDNIAGLVLPSGSYVPRPLIHDLDQIPFPARALFNISQYRPSVRRSFYSGPFSPIIASRGCPFDCSFCSAHCVFGKSYRKRTDENIISEIKECVHKYDIHNLVFYDDNRFAITRRADEDAQIFCDKLLSEGLDIVWQMELRSDVASRLSRKTLALLYRSGCRQINIGFEKGSNEGLEKLNKSITVEDSIAAVANIRSAIPDMRITGTFVLGGPGETDADIQRTIDFACDLGLDYAHFYPLEVYPGTRLFEELKRNGSIRSDTGLWASETEPWGEVIYQTSAMRKDDILNWVRRAYWKFYLNIKWVFKWLRRDAKWSSFVKMPFTLLAWWRNRFRL